MHEALNFMSIRERIEYNVCILIHKMIMRKCPDYLKNKVELMGTDRRVQTRQKGNIHISRCKTREEQKMMLHDGFKMYNFIPNEIKNENRLQNFRKALMHLSLSLSLTVILFYRDLL